MTKRDRKGEVPYSPCPPEEFAGRSDEREQLLEILSHVSHRGQVAMITGARGSGKTSFLDWAEHEIQNRKGGFENPAFKKEFLETPGMIFTTYEDLLRELKGHKKFGWFRKTLESSKVKKSLEIALGVLEKGSSLAGPAKPVVDAGTAAAKGFLPSEKIGYSQLLSSLLETLRSVSDELLKNERFLVILCDDAQWSSEPDCQLLKDLMRNIPQSVALVIAFRLEDKSIEKYVDLRGELDRFGHTEIHLSAMAPEEIRDFASKRYGLSIDDSTTQFLSLNIGDPLCLVSCFNILQRRNLEPTLATFQKVMPEAVDPVRCIYSELDQQWKDRVDSLCILHPPLSLVIIACMLNIEDQHIASLKDELNQSVVFKRLDKESYEFAHPSLREYRKKELPESVMVALHSQAAKCLEGFRAKFPEKFVDLSLAEHLFLGHEYEKALALNLQLGDQFYDFFDFHSALEFTQRAKICAEMTNNSRELSAALHQTGMILQAIFSFSDSLDAYNQSLTVEREVGDHAGEALPLHQIGRVYEDTNRFDEALDFYNQSLTIEREVGDKSGEEISLRTIKALKEKMRKK
jgi:tetratricopeptide (TPR) repeat protein